MDNVSKLRHPWSNVAVFLFNIGINHKILLRAKIFQTVQKKFSKEYKNILP